MQSGSRQCRAGEAHLVDIWSEGSAQSFAISSSPSRAVVGSRRGSILVMVPSFTFVVGFLFGAQQAPTGAISDQLKAHLVQGCECTSHGFGFDVLIRRDIICKRALSLSFDGNYMLAF
jgi:hypothetical protein